MRKLNKNKVCWVVQQCKKGELSHWQIAKQMKVSKRWINKIMETYTKTGELPVPGKPGRTPIPVTKEEMQLVNSFKEEFGYGATNLEKIMKTHNMHLPHNRIHKVLKLIGKAKNEKRKQGKRKWIRYERRHSNSLWHTDWFEYQGLQIIAFLDDASRLVTGVGVFDNATAENAVLVLKQAMQDYSKPKQVCSDWGTQFTADLFQQALKENNIQHVKARVKHPQTNGKIERWWQTLKHNTEHFGDLSYAVWFYNHKRPHMSLEKNDGTLVTPIQAFKNKQKKVKP